MLLAEVVAVSRAVAATSGRLAKVELLAAALRDAGAADVEIVVPWLSGELRQRRTGIGWAALRELPPAAAEPSLTVAGVDQAFAAAAAATGPGSATARRQLVHELFATATSDEQAWLRALVSGDVRQGALDGVMVDALARAADVPLPLVRRAVMLRGAIAPVATAALADGEAGLAAFRLTVGRPLSPMLAGTATSVEDAMARLRAVAVAGASGGDAVAVDWKLDGIRVQVHKRGDHVAVFTRSLDDITARVPELVAAARELPSTDLVLDGEAISLREDGRPRPFQQTGSRAASRGSTHQRLSWFVFDLLHVDGDDVLDLPLADRLDRLRAVAPEQLRVPRVITDSVAEAAGVLRDALDRGHEGVVVKSLCTPYAAGRRGPGWLKVKPVHTLDLVVLAAEWGSGRRRGWLSNLHLGARDPVSGEFVMLGKTFKGLTDEVLAWQTERLQQIATARSDWVVTVAPQLVVEIAFDGVQVSSRYPGGVALRFARVVRYREDKSPTESDTIDAVRRFLT